MAEFPLPFGERIKVRGETPKKPPSLRVVPTGLPRHQPNAKRKLIVEHDEGQPHEQHDAAQHPTALEK